MRTILARLLPAFAAATALFCAPPAGATSTPQQVSTAVKAGASYLEGLQESSGRFQTDWVLGALAASGQPLSGVKPQGTGTDARSAYRSLVGEPSTWPGAGASVSDFERAALNTYAAGIDPARVSAGQNLLARILGFYDAAAPGWYGGSQAFTATVFAALALGETPTRQDKPRIPSALLEKTVTVLEENQHSDGGWNYEKVQGNQAAVESEAEPDETGAVLAALCGAGVPASATTVSRGLSYLEGDLQSDGSFAAPFGPNSDSNAWAVQGLTACGINPQGPAFTTAAGHTPIDFLIAGQLAGGGFVYEHGEAAANEYSSQDAVRALAGGTFTAAPPKGKGGQFLYQKAFTAGTDAQLGLVISTAGGLKVCAVTIDPTASKSTLGAALAAAQAGSEPAGCVTGYAPSTGAGKLATVDGTTATAGHVWQVSLDGAKAASAKLSSKIAVGDVIYLALD
jgi:hypothetical protein